MALSGRTRTGSYLDTSVGGSGLYRYPEGATVTIDTRGSTESRLGRRSTVLYHSKVLSRLFIRTPVDKVPRAALVQQVEVNDPVPPIQD